MSNSDQTKASGQSKSGTREALELRDGGRRCKGNGTEKPVANVLDPTTVADVAIEKRTGRITVGSLCRSNRVGKYSQLLRIEDAEAACALYDTELVPAKPQNGGRS